MTTLADILKKKQERSERAERPKVTYFSLTNNNPARIQFLQELDPDAPNFNAAHGSALFLVEHVSPEDFKRKALCTMETEGRCFACEMNQEDPKGNWWAKTNMYVQVLDAKDNKIKVLSRPAPGTFFDPLYEWAQEENGGSVMNATLKITKPEGKQTSWAFIQTKNELNVPESVFAELVDLEAAIGYKVEFDKQRSYYLPNGDPGTVAEEKAAVESKKEDDSDAW